MESSVGKGTSGGLDVFFCHEDDVKKQTELVKGGPRCEVGDREILGGLLCFSCFFEELLQIIWLVLSDQQMSKRWPFSLLNGKQMTNWLGVKHLPVILSHEDVSFH